MRVRVKEAVNQNSLANVSSSDPYPKQHESEISVLNLRGEGG